MVNIWTGSSRTSSRGRPCALRDMPSSLKVVAALAAAVLRSSASSSSSAVQAALLVPDIPTGTTNSASDVVAVNEGLVVTGSVHYGAVPIPNLCVELRGYQTSATATEGSKPPGTLPEASDVNSPDPAAATTGGPGWGMEGEPRFVQLRRTGTTDGSFTFVTPESGVILVLAAYSPDGDHPAAVRVFPGNVDDDDSRRGVDQGRAARPIGTGAFGHVGSGRVQVHIDLMAEGNNVPAPEKLWSRATAAAAAAAAADLANDRSPCARREAADARADAAAAVAADAAAAAAATGSSIGSGTTMMAGPDFVAGSPKPESSTAFDRALTALSALGRSSYSGLCQLGADLWNGSAGACAAFLSRLETARKDKLQEGSAAGSLLSSRRLSVWLEHTSAQFRTWSQERSGSLSTWFGHKWTQFSTWLDQTSSLLSLGFDKYLPWLSPHLQQYGPFEVDAWWAVWWVRAVCIALLLGVLQQAFCCITRASSSATGADREDSETAGDTSTYESHPHQDLDTTGTDSMVATVHNADGTRSRLDLGKLERPAEPAAKREGMLKSVWGVGGSTLGPAEETQGKEEGSDEFSSMFRALSQPACALPAPTEGNAGGASSNFVVVTQQSWTQEAGDSRDY